MQPDEPFDGKRAAAERRGLLRIDEAALGQHERQRTEAAAVGGHGVVGVSNGAQGEAGGGEATGLRRIARAAQLRISTREIESHAIAIDDDGDLNAHGTINVDAVVVEPVDVAVSSVGNLGDGFAGQALGVSEERIEQRQHMRVAIGLCHLLETSGTDGTRSDLGIDVAHEDVRQPNVEPHDLDQRVVEFAAVAQLYGRQAETLLENLGGVGRRGAWRHAASVLVMGQRGGEANDLAVVKHRLDDGDVGNVRAARRIGSFKM